MCAPRASAGAPISCARGSPRPPDNAGKGQYLSSGPRRPTEQGGAQGRRLVGRARPLGLPCAGAISATGTPAESRRQRARTRHSARRQASTRKSRLCAHGASSGRSRRRPPGPDNRTPASRSARAAADPSLVGTQLAVAAKWRNTQGATRCGRPKLSRLLGPPGRRAAPRPAAQSVALGGPPQWANDSGRARQGGTAPEGLSALAHRLLGEIGAWRIDGLCMTASKVGHEDCFRRSDIPHPSRPPSPGKQVMFCLLRRPISGNAGLQRSPDSSTEFAWPARCASEVTARLSRNMRTTMAVRHLHEGPLGCIAAMTIKG